MNNDVNKLDMKSLDIVKKNIENIGKLFPNVVIEGKIDFEKLKNELSNELIENNKERYQLTWSGKKEAILTSNTTINKTLRPIKEKSVDFDNTRNIYIEGDNLDTLKILQQSYVNKIKLIYIDPPYNTGNDFIYKDNYYKLSKKEGIDSGELDENENRLVTNQITNGRFHSDWLSMIYPRLKLARNLLKDDGFIFISIDYNESANLRKVCDEIFGESNFISDTFVLDNLKGKTNDNYITSVGSKLMIYAKNKTATSDLGFNQVENLFAEKIESKFQMEDDLGFYTDVTFKKTGQSKYREDRPFMYYPILVKDNIIYAITDDEYEQIYDKVNKKFNDNFISELKDKYKDYEFILPMGSNGEKLRWTSGFNTFKEKKNRDIYYNSGIKQKVRPEANEMLQIYASGTPKSLMYKPTYSIGTQNLKELISEDVFDFPKPVDLIKDILHIVRLEKNDIILDFFSGSATTAQAVFEFNVKSNMNCKFILVQLPEIINAETDAYKNGYETICDVGEERVRRAGKKYDGIDYGFRVYEVDSSNMKDVYYKPEDLKQEQLDFLESNIKEDRTAEDLLTQVILDLGLTLDMKIEEKNILSNKVYFVANNSLIACFDEKINIDIIEEICKDKPLKLVFRESSFNSDSDKINTYERIKKLSPETEINVI